MAPGKGSTRHQLILALADDGGLSMPTRLVARVLAAAWSPQKWPLAKSRERKDPHFSHACCPPLLPHGVLTAPHPHHGWAERGAGAVAAAVGSCASAGPVSWEGPGRQ